MAKCMITNCTEKAVKILYSKIHNASKSLYGSLCDEHAEKKLNEFLDKGRDAELHQYPDSSSS